MKTRIPNAIYYESIKTIEGLQNRFNDRPMGSIEFRDMLEAYQFYMKHSSKHQGLIIKGRKG